MSPTESAGQPLVIVLLGPTASGKTDLAIALAQALDIKPATISVTQGATSRDKTLLVMGDATLLAARLEAL